MDRDVSFGESGEREAQPTGQLRRATPARPTLASGSLDQAARRDRTRVVGAIKQAVTITAKVDGSGTAEADAFCP